MIRIIVALILVGCGGPRSETVEPVPVEPGSAQPEDPVAKPKSKLEGHCQAALEKSMPLLVELTKAHPRPVVASDLEILENDCINYKWEAQLKDPDITCLYEAKDDVALRACWATSLARPRDKTEAIRALEKAATGATVVLRRDGALPRGDIFSTPTIPCCARIGHRCRGGYDHLIWKELDFRYDYTSAFQLAYQSDGAKLVIKAVGDLDCDGTTITYTLEGSVQGDEVRYKIVEPTNPD
jgi:hypothetical protein